MMNILIGSDLVPTKSNLASFCSGKVDEIIGESILELFATFSLVNSGQNA